MLFVVVVVVVDDDDIFTLPSLPDEESLFPIIQLGILEVVS
jgi:hypothetical protein